MQKRLRDETGDGGGGGADPDPSTRQHGRHAETDGHRERDGADLESPEHEETSRRMPPLVAHSLHAAESRASACETPAVRARRLVPLVLAVSGLLAVAALASHGRPLSRSHGSGPTTTFFDYVFTSIVIVAVAAVVLFVLGLLGSKPARQRQQRARLHPLQFVLTIVAAFVIGYFLLHAHFHHLAKPRTSNPNGTSGSGNAPPARPNAHARGARLRWDEVAIVAALLAAAGVAAFASRSRMQLKEWRFRSYDDIAAALDESLDDLRSEPDLRRAIIAAYARMERALAAAGLPRWASEAPSEYLQRALASLDTSGESVARLTELFERAKFSQHDPDPSMRDEAIDALTAVRDELRRPVEEAA